MIRRTALLLIAVGLLAGCGGLQPTAIPAAPTDTAAAPLPTAVATGQASPTASLLPSATASAVPTEAVATATVAPATATPVDAAAGPAVVASRDGDLWLKSLPDGPEVRLTQLTDVTGFPEFSPDGELILFQREGPPALVSRSMGEEVPTSTWWAVAVPDGAPYMVLEPLDALPPVQSSEEAGADVYPSEPGPFDWLPGGREILFTTRYLVINGAPGNYDLWRLDVETGELLALLPLGEGGRPVVSPDGEWVLLSTQTEITIARVDGSERRSLLNFERVPTYSEWEWVPQPVWNDDGTLHVAVPRGWNVGEPVTYELWQLDAATGDEQWLGLVDTSWLYTPLWSPDRSRLAYAAAGGGLGLAGGSAEDPRVVAAGEDVVPIAWSPGGRWVAFVQGGDHCVVEDREGAEPICVAPVFYGDAEWLDDDTLIVVANAGVDQPQFVAVELPGGETTALWSTPPPLFYDIYAAR